MRTLLLGTLLLAHTSYAFDIVITKPDGGVYYRFWFVYAILSVVTTVLLIVFSSVSMCRRYKLVANQGDEISEHQL